MVESPHQNKLMMENSVFQERNILQPREGEGPIQTVSSPGTSLVDTNCYCDNVMGGGRGGRGDNFLPLIIV